MHDQLREQVIALTGVWQAVNLVDELANNTELDKQQKKRFDCCIDSTLIIRTETAEQVYAPIKNLEFSMLSLYSFLKGTEIANKDSPVYMFKLFKLQKIMSANAQMSKYIADDISRLEIQKNYFREQRSLLVENLARLYSETFGSLNFNQRIRVKGKPEVLQVSQTQHAIRAVLLAGIRGVMLWRQMRGSRLPFLFQRKKLERKLQSMLNY